LPLITWLDARLYPGVGRNWDDGLLRERILARLTPAARVLDLGAGAGIVPHMAFRGLASVVCGLDPDPRVVGNPHLDDGRVGVGEAIPWPNATFDLVFADNVLEHLEHPALVFAEVARVLTPGGVFLAKTPNALHYMPLIARLTPHRFHQWVNRRRGRGEADTFPTRYRANTPRAIRRLAAATGLEVLACELVEGRPEYLRLSAPTYVLGWFYERLVNLSPRLAPLRIVMLVTLTKPGGPQP
jgi:SAM-dependent methyltransferase